MTGPVLGVPNEQLRSSTAAANPASSSRPPGLIPDDNGRPPWLCWPNEPNADPFGMLPASAFDGADWYEREKLFPLLYLFVGPAYELPVYDWLYGASV